MDFPFIPSSLSHLFPLFSTIPYFSQSRVKYIDILGRGGERKKNNEQISESMKDN